MAQVAGEAIEESNRVPLPNVLKHALRIAEFEIRLPPSFVLGHSSRHIVVDLVRDIRLDLFAELRLLGVAAEEPAQTHCGIPFPSECPRRGRAQSPSRAVANVRSQPPV